MCCSGVLCDDVVRIVVPSECVCVWICILFCVVCISEVWVWKYLCVASVYVSDLSLLCLDSCFMFSRSLFCHQSVVFSLRCWIFMLHHLGWIHTLSPCWEAPWYRDHKTYEGKRTMICCLWLCYDIQWLTKLNGPNLWWPHHTVLTKLLFQICFLLGFGMSILLEIRELSLTDSVAYIIHLPGI